MIEHHCRRKNHCNRIHDRRIQPGILRRGPMRRLKDRHVIANVAGRRESQPSHQPRERVGKNVPEQIRRYDYVIVLRILVQPHQLRVDVRRPKRNSGIVLRHFFGHFFHHPRGLAHHIRLLANRHALESALLRIFESRGHDALGRLASDDAATHSDLRPRHIGKRLEPGVAIQRGAHVLGRVRPLHTCVHAFRVLPEHGGVNARLVESAARLLANIVQRIAREPDARTHADIEIELLPHGHDRRVINVTLPLQFGFQFRLGRLVRLRSNRPKQAQLMLGQ